MQIIDYAPIQLHVQNLESLFNFAKANFVINVINCNAIARSGFFF